MAGLVAANRMVRRMDRVGTLGASLVPGAVHVTARTTSSGRRYDVRYRRGGRGYKLERAGTFRTVRDANERKNLVAGWIAAGLDPRDELTKILAPKVAPLSFYGWYDRLIASRVDAAPSTLALCRNARDRLGSLADIAPRELTPADFQEWIAENRDLSPATLANYLSKHRLVLDFADVLPNPARSPKVKLPSESKEEVTPPSAQEWAEIKTRLVGEKLLVLRLAEATAMRIGELVSLQQGDVDFAGERFRISARRTKGRSSGQRWLPVPPELLEKVEALLPPLEDRTPERPVFRPTHGSVRKALDAACKLAGVAHYHPHDLRHRRVSLWVAHGIDPVTIKTWAGHSRASMSLDVYAHVVTDTAGDEWADFWLERYEGRKVARV